MASEKNVNYSNLKETPLDHQNVDFLGNLNGVFIARSKEVYIGQRRLFTCLKEISNREEPKV